jgi:hypothetical protein
MVAVVLLAVGLAGFRAMMRPIPMAESVEVSTGKTFWSDGVVTNGSVAEPEVPRPVEVRNYPFFLVARWSDGSVSFRLFLQ